MYPPCKVLTLCRCAFCRLFEPKYTEFRRFYPQAKMCIADHGLAYSSAADNHFLSVGKYFKLDVDIVEVGSLVSN